MTFVRSSRKVIGKGRHILRQNDFYIYQLVRTDLKSWEQDLCQSTGQNNAWGLKYIIAELLNDLSDGPA